MRAVSISNERVRWIIAAIVGVYLLAFRVYGVDESFALLGEQVRDWSVAQRPFESLPLVGPRSANSGLDIGPVYYRFLWLSRVALGPFADNLPHAGAWAQAVLQTLGDVVLLVALWRTFGSGWAATAVVVGAATSTLDVHLTTTIWNPPVAVAFVKLSAAAALWKSPVSPWTAAATLGLLSLAVQAHVSAILVAIPLALATLWSVGRHQGVRATLPALGAVAILSAPWALGYAASGTTGLPTSDAPQSGVLASIDAVLRDPGDRIHVRASAAGVATSLEFLLGSPFAVPWLRWMILAGALAALIRVRNLVLSAWCAGSVGMAIALFTVWQGSFEYYWFLVIVPAAATCLAAPILATHGRARNTLIALSVFVVLAIQPARAAEAWVRWRQPEYGVLVAAARAVVKKGTPVREIRTTFVLPDGMDPYFILVLLGGRLDAAGPIAVIDSDASVAYQ